MKSRHLAAVLAAALGAAALAGGAHAAFPEKAVKLTVGYSPGSSTDTAGRIVADGLAKLWGQPVVIDSHPGAAGNIAADVVAKAAPDGYTILFAQNGTAISVASNPKLPYDGLKDLIPVAQAAATPHILIVNSSLPAKNVAELTALAKSKPNKLTFASSGVGNSDHMAGELYKVMAGVTALHVPYKGGAPAATDLIAGQIDFYFAGMPVGLAQYKGGKVRALAVTSKERNPALPDIPTVIESGIKGFEVVGFYGFLAPAGLPKDVTAKLSDAFKQVMASPDIRNRMVTQGADPAFMGSDEFAQFLAAEMPRWAQAVKASGARLD